MISPAELPLRDVHLPDGISWWPPAPGWWLLSAMLLIAAGVGLWRCWRAWHRRRPRQRARCALARIRTDYWKSGDTRQLLRDLSVCLRRVALTVAPRREVAALTGRTWLAFLDRYVPGRPFQSGVGRILAEGPYQPAPDFDVEALLRLSAQAIEAMTRGRGRTPC